MMGAGLPHRASELRKQGTPTRSTRIAKPEQLVKQVRQECPFAIEALYGMVYEIARPYLRWRLGERASDESEDCVHEAFLAALEAIQSEAIRDPARLRSFILTIVRHKATVVLRKTTRDRRQLDVEECLHLIDQAPGQERLLMISERSRLLQHFLQQLGPSEREILIRFYLSGHSRERICRDLELTPNQFRLRKSRAKARLTRIVAQSLTKPQS